MTLPNNHYATNVAKPRRKVYAPRSIAEVMTPKRIRRFRSKVLIVGDCHLWQGGCNKQGYGLFQGCTDYQGYSLLVHRIAYWLATGVEPVNDILHSCDTPPCVNPDHLRDGTPLDNAADMITRGHGQTEQRSNLTGRPRLSCISEAIRLRYEQRLLQKEIAKSLGVHRSTLIRWFKEYEEHCAAGVRVSIK